MLARMQLAVEMWPSSMSATGRLRFSTAARKSSIWRRVAGAAFSSIHLILVIFRIHREPLSHMSRCLDAYVCHKNGRGSTLLGTLASCHVPFGRFPWHHCASYSDEPPYRRYGALATILVDPGCAARHSAYTGVGNWSAGNPSGGKLVSLNIEKRW
jgi:hypothetical protein